MMINPSGQPFLHKGQVKRRVWATLSFKSKKLQVPWGDSLLGLGKESRNSFREICDYYTKTKHQTIYMKNVTFQRKIHSFPSLKGVHDLKRH